MSFKVNGEIVRLTESVAERAATATTYEFDGQASVAFRLTELDQTDPAGRWQFIATGGQLLLQKAATANWGSATTLWSLDSGGAFVSAVAATPALVAKNTNDAASVAVASFEGDRATMADDDEAYISLKMSDDAGTQTEVARLRWQANDVTDTTEDGYFGLSVLQGGTLRAMLNVFSSAAGVLNFVVNPSNLDVDIQMSADTNANAFTIDGGLNGGVGVASFGGAAVADRQLRVGHPAVSATANASYFTLYATQSGAVTVPAGTAPIVASLAATEPNITATGTVTDAVTFYLADAPTEGTRNWYIAVGGAPPTVFGISGAGALYLGDNANANITVGATLNQGGNDDGILAFKSSDVTHTFTGLIEADSYADFRKATAAEGGLVLRGLSSGTVGLSLIGDATTADATRTTAGVAPILLSSALPAAGVEATVGANQNLLAVRDLTTTRFILDSDGDSHQDVGTAWTNFDTHDDVSLLTSLAAAVSRPGNEIADQFREFVGYNAAELERVGIISGTEPGHTFVNMSRLSMLLVGAVRQMGLKVKVLEDRIAALPEARA